MTSVPQIVASIGLRAAESADVGAWRELCLTGEILLFSGVWPFDVVQRSSHRLAQ